MYTQLINSIGMDSDINYIAQSKSNSQVSKLSVFLDNETFKTSKNNPYTNVINQGKCETFHIPFRYRNNDANNTFDISDTASVNDILNNSNTIPIDELMHLLEDCRRCGVILNISELQYFQVPVRIDAPPATQNIEVDGIDLEEIQEYKSMSIKNPTFVNLKNDMKIDKSGIDFDFDMYQRERTRVDDAQYNSLLLDVLKDVLNTIDVNSCSDPTGVIQDIQTNNVVMNFHCCILRKPDIVECNHKDYGNCYKESFRIRIPGIKITKEHKKYIINSIAEKHEIVSDLFNNLGLCGSWNKILDAGSATHPIMFLGSAKRGNLVAHEFYKLWSVIYRPDKQIIRTTPLTDFDPIIEPGAIQTIKLKDPVDGRKKISKKLPVKYRYNLCYELSINYEAPRGLIKKREFKPKQELETEIKTHSERSSMMSIDKDYMIEVRNNLADLTVRNYEAAYLQKILDILSEDRAKTYENWRWIIYILAWTNPDYKWLAI